MFYKNRIEELRASIKYALDELDKVPRKDTLHVDCVKCGMTGLKSKMKCEKKIVSAIRFNIFGDSSYDDKIVQEYTCIHCQQKTKK